MPFPIPHFQPEQSAPATEPPMVHVAPREDVLWNRPVFRAPPLQFHPEAFDATIYARELCRLGIVNR